ncbi:hypothetical protein EVAR_65658_1 [Eumeta japonica]|uniref:Uncharacterized protein n=1 Tax=Eumeta variegata TaxID=151549 RepID=A0A4C1Z7B1_EUMVA|nr:hypothetical protein EVAR_65658_1 [Eumeta japonica]
MNICGSLHVLQAVSMSCDVLTAQYTVSARDLLPALYITDIESSVRVQRPTERPEDEGKQPTAERSLFSATTTASHPGPFPVEEYPSSTKIKLLSSTVKKLKTSLEFRPALGLPLRTFESVSPLQHQPRKLKSFENTYANSTTTTVRRVLLLSVNRVSRLAGGCGMTHDLQPLLSQDALYANCHTAKDTTRGNLLPFSMARIYISSPEEGPDLCLKDLTEVHCADIHVVLYLYDF